MSEAFNISFYALVVAMTLLAIVFITIPLPKIKGIQNYAVSLKVLAICYLSLACYCVFKPQYPIQLISVPFLVNSMLQAHFLTLSHINMVSPRSITIKYIIKKVLPLFIICTIYIIIRLFEPHITISHYSDLFLKQTVDGSYESYWYMNGKLRWEVILRIGWMIYYFILSATYCIIYFKEEHICKEKLQEYTADFPGKNLTLIRISFILVMIVATTSMLIPLSLCPKVCAVLNFIMLILYCAIGVLYLQYPKVFLNIYQSTDEEICGRTKGGSVDDTWATWKQRIVDSGIYLKQGITIQQICQELCTNRKSLSTLINQEEACNFNSFINKLRIEKAKQLMTESDLTLLDISLEVGYSDQGNFSRHFKEVTGESPSEWKRNSAYTTHTGREN